MSVLARAWSAVKPYRKAVAGFVTPGLIAIGYALLPTSPGGSGITSGEWSAAAASMLATAGVVWKVSNQEKQG
jgi:hypothetical protein